MEMTLTSKDKKLLAFLACVLILLGLGYYVVLPLNDHAEELNAQIDEETLTQMEMQMKISTYPASQKRYEELQQEAADATKEYYGLLTTQEVDKELTNIVLSQKLECVNLSIEQMMLADVEAYSRSSLARAREMGALVANANAAASGEADTGDAADPAGDAAAETEAAAQADLGVQDQIYSYRAHMTVDGAEANFQKLVDLLLAEYPAIRITGINYQQGQAPVVVRADGTTTTGKAKKQMVLDLELYMCNKALYEQASASSGMDLGGALSNILQSLMGAGS